MCPRKTVFNRVCANKQLYWISSSDSYATKAWIEAKWVFNSQSLKQGSLNDMYIYPSEKVDSRTQANVNAAPLISVLFVWTLDPL